ncbi:hypothetical protein EDL80_04085, partial [Ehrlichia ruminantium]
NGNSDSSSRRSSTSDSTRSGNSGSTETLSFASLRYSSESETEDDVNNNGEVTNHNPNSNGTDMSIDLSDMYVTHIDPNGIYETRV